MKTGDLRRKFFIAIFPPRDVAEKVEKIMLKGPRHGGWSWAKKDDLHLSLAFPGHLSNDDLGKLKEALAKTVHRAFSISLSGMSFFLDNRNQVKKAKEHVLWAKTDFRADNEMKTLHREIIGLMKGAGFKIGRDDFSPHMTLAKVEKDEIDLMKHFANACGSVKTRPWKCDSFAVYESLTRQNPAHPANNNGRGSKYRKVAEFTLAA